MASSVPFARLIQTTWTSLAAAILGSVLLVVGCGTPRQTVTVAERPEARTDTVTAMRDTTTLVPIPGGYDTVQVGAFDRGKLWPFEHLPVEYFRSEYGVDTAGQWNTKARRAALRFGENCSASFVSARGLVMTNHHCAREAISNVHRRGEDLLERGFYADSLGREQRVPSLYVEEIVKIKDVTRRIREGGEDRDTRGLSREQRIEQVENEMTEKAKTRDERLRVDIVSLYRGAEYSAYTYRRHEDVRLVMVPELQVGYFGGAADNFTYPRYTFDVAFFRVYTKDDTPLKPSYHFSWDESGTEIGETVFAVGNPGSTSRLETVSQFKYKRDHTLPNRTDVLRERRDLLQAYLANHPTEAEQADLRNTLFTLENSLKGAEGKLEGLKDPALLARRAKALRALQDSMAQVDSLNQYGRVVGEVRRLQQSKRILADREKAFFTLANTTLGPRILTRAVHAYYYDFLRKRGAREDRVQSIREDAEEMQDWPDELERSFMAAQFQEIRSAYGPNHPTIQRLFRDRTPQELAARLVEKSALMDSTKFVKLLGDGYLKSNDPSVPVIEALAPLFLNVNRQMQDLRRTEETLNGRLSRARRVFYGNRVSPDATFTLRISDGAVKGYSEDGNRIPAFTDFAGMYERHRARSGDDWALPERWLSVPDSFDVGTPLNVVSTVDISGGSSGSPLLNKDLEVVGVVFDGNMQSLPNKYLYRTRAARAIAVDARGILEVLRDLYGATRLVEEIVGGQHNTKTATKTEAQPTSDSR
ncbi:MAG: S46 family peptidase [Bacteroidetes bacterium SW_9_63_38]|nr:MAG: S46 family peptidase [Bacteroidetes bacterium SW_9_63_38]